jgi:hypothetical protein
MKRHQELHAAHDNLTLEKARAERQRDEALAKVRSRPGEKKKPKLSYATRGKICYCGGKP